MSAHDLAAARLEALNMRTERDNAQREAAELREQIAQQIEAFHSEQCGPAGGVWATVCTCLTAAAIARGVHP